MANGKIRFGKQSGGQLALVIPDGVSNTEVTFPESGELATKDYIATKVVRDLGMRILQGVVGSSVSCTTAQFITWLKGIGAFSSTSSRLRFTWDYADNNIISDIPDGTLCVAGSQVDISNEGTEKYTITIITPNSYHNATIPGGSIYVYNSQGPGYNSGWRRVYTSSAYGVATHINSTTLDSTGRHMTLSGRLSSSGVGNQYDGSGLETRGDGGSIYPSISFHHPGKYANTIRNTNGGLFEFMLLNNVDYSSIRAADGLFNSLVINRDGTGSYIHMGDSDEGTRIMHCNSNRIGFLNQAGNWGAWCNDDGSWEVDGSISSTLYKGKSTNLPLSKCIGRISFNSTNGTVYTASGVCSGVTIHGAGHFSVNFAPILPNTSYTASVMCSTAGQGANVYLHLKETHRMQMVAYYGGDNTIGPWNPWTVDVHIFSN